MTILDELADAARARVAADARLRPLPELRRAAVDVAVPQPFAFERALAAPGLSFICEVKKASPSKGLISPDFPYLDIATDYAAAGASAISVLTEPTRFLGSDENLREIAASVDVPVLRKDFVVDEYQIWQARELGASAVLLICALLTPDQLADYRALADDLGLSCLIEAHVPDEIGQALEAGARVIGVNNRDLRDFSVDLSTAAWLRSLVPPSCLFVAESGVSGPADAASVAATGADAVLVGEALMRAPSRRVALETMRVAARGAERPAPVAAASASEGEDPGISTPRIKICGISRDEDIPVLNETLPDFVGFVFAPTSRRRVDLETALRLRAQLDPRIQTVGVFVDQPVREIAEAVKSGAIGWAQLHGDESHIFLRLLHAAVPGVRTIRAIGVADLDSILDAPLADADSLLFDNVRGGSGQRFDWGLIAQARATVRAQGTVLPPLFLAGGLDTGCVAQAIAAVHPDAVDVSSGVETEGVKDAAKVRAFVAAVRNGGR